MSTRPDLLALTPAALASLANMGLLKRAQKELEQGKGATVVLEPDGTLVATFPEGVTTRLVPGKGLAESPCTCGATGVCRHRVGAVLALQAAPPASTEAPPPNSDTAPWSPGDTDDATILRLFGRAAVDRATAARRRGVLAEVRRPSAHEEHARVTLATSTVRFLVDGDVSWARCDCVARTACEHVVLAILAFRAADARDRAAPLSTVELVDAASAAARRLPGVLETAVEVADLVLLEGVTRLPEAASARFALARGALERAGLAWPLAVLEDVEEQLDAYRRRSARYAASHVGAALAELHARARAGAGGGELPARFVLGADEALEARLDQIRLTGLGARVEADGEGTAVEVYLCDPVDSSILVLRRAWTEVLDGPAVAGRGLVGGATLGAAASGQLVSNAAVRRPDRRVTFSTGPLRKTTVLRGGGLDSVVAVENVPAWVQALRDRAPRALRPHRLAEDLRVFRVGGVEQVGWEESAQAVHAVCQDTTGAPFFVELAHRPVAPGALQSLALALASPNLTAIVGDGRKRGDRLVVTPISALVGHELQVLDLAAPSDAGATALAALPRLRTAPVTPLAAVVTRTREILDDAVHHGLRALTGAWIDRLRAAAARLRAVGLVRVGADLEALEMAWLAAQASGGVAEEAAVCAAWADAVVRVEVVGERA